MQCGLQEFSISPLGSSTSSSSDIVICESFAAFRDLASGLTGVLRADVKALSWVRTVMLLPQITLRPLKVSNRLI